MKKINKIILLTSIILSSVSFSKRPITDKEKLDIYSSSNLNIFDITDTVTRETYNRQIKLRDTKIFTDAYVNAVKYIPKKFTNINSFSSSLNLGYENNKSRLFNYGVSLSYINNLMNYELEDIDKPLFNTNNAVFLTDYFLIKKELTDYSFIHTIGYFYDRLSNIDGNKKNEQAIINTFNFKVIFKQILFSPYLGYSLDIMNKFDLDSNNVLNIGRINNNFVKSRLFFGNQSNLNLGKFQLVLSSEIGYNILTKAIDRSAKSNNEVVIVRNIPYRLFDSAIALSTIYKINKNTKILVEYSNRNGNNNTIKLGLDYLL